MKSKSLPLQAKRDNGQKRVKERNERAKIPQRTKSRLRNSTHTHTQTEVFDHCRQHQHENAQ